MKRPTVKTVIADDLTELEQKTADAATRRAMQTQIDIEDYTAGGKLKLDPGEPPPTPDEGLLPPPGENDGPMDTSQLAPDDNAINVLNARRAKIHEQQRAASAPPRVPDVFPNAGVTRYESRIRIVEAWQYNGNLAEAPPYIDRSWAAWGEWDEERKIEPGPALRVPMQQGRETEKVCRKGDYVVRQEVTLSLELLPDVVIEVWQKEEFEKFFLPTRTSPPEDGQGETGEGEAA